MSYQHGVYEYHGLLRAIGVQELQTFDIVLTTYNILSAERRLQESPINKIQGWRIILDEAHVIKNVNAQHSKAVMGLKSKRRWAVTGTPIQNGLFDLFSIMIFLRFEPFSIKNYWLSLVQCPITEGKAGGLSFLQVKIMFTSIFSFIQINMLFSLASLNENAFCLSSKFLMYCIQLL